MELHHLAFRTPSLASLTDFYQRALGFEKVGGKSGYSNWLRMGSSVLMLEERPVDEPGITPGCMEFVGFGVSETQRTVIRAKLQGMGVIIEAESDSTTYFRDPDGRRIGVSHFEFSDLDSGACGDS